ncbi:MAG: hypothetical protein KDB00_29215 [Planctomycetales bacterium]|nr:hypothetical protein [Planctomycetales bacterium]
MLYVKGFDHKHSLIFAIEGENIISMKTRVGDVPAAVASIRAGQIPKPSGMSSWIDHATVSEVVAIEHVPNRYIHLKCRRGSKDITLTLFDGDPAKAKSLIAGFKLSTEPIPRRRTIGEASFTPGIVFVMTTIFALCLIVMSTGDVEKAEQAVRNNPFDRHGAGRQAARMMHESAGPVGFYVLAGVLELAAIGFWAFCILKRPEAQVFCAPAAGEPTTSSTERHASQITKTTRRLRPIEFTITTLLVHPTFQELI